SDALDPREVLRPGPLEARQRGAEPVGPRGRATRAHRTDHLVVSALEQRLQEVAPEKACRAGQQDAPWAGAPRRTALRRAPPAAGQRGFWLEESGEGSDVRHGLSAVTSDDIPVRASRRRPRPYRSTPGSGSRKTAAHRGPRRAPHSIAIPGAFLI